MADGAKVQDIDAIRMFRAHLIKFIEAGNAALADAESDLQRRQAWCEGDQTAFWNFQIRKINELIGQLKEAIRSKQLFKDATGRTDSAFDEQKKLRAAQQKLEIAEKKLANCRRWGKELQREHLNFRGGVQRLQTMLSSDLVNSVGTLDSIVARIDAYLNAGGPTMAESQASPSAPAGEMRRSADEALPTAQPADAAEPAVDETSKKDQPE